VSAYLSDVARAVTRTTGAHWLPGSMALVVLGTALALVLYREVTRGALTAEREQRVRSTAVVVVPLLLSVALAMGARLIDLIT
jgi:hypothetical protein